MSATPSPADLPTSRLRRRTPGSFILVPYPRAGRSLRCQGHLRADAARVLIACPQVTHVQEQPVTIWYAWRPAPGGCQIRLLAGPPARACRKGLPFGVSYVVPDLLVTMADGAQRLVELKPARKLDDPVVRRKLAVAALFARGRGWAFRALTEREVRHGPLLANLRLLRRYGRLPSDTRLVEQLAPHVPPTGVRLGDLLRLAASPGAAPAPYPRVLSLLCGGELTFDPCARPLDPDTLLFPKGAVSWDPFASAWAPSGCSTGGPTAWCASPPPTGSSPST
jgi:hypothetical protein